MHITAWICEIEFFTAKQLACRTGIQYQLQNKPYLAFIVREDIHDVLVSYQTIS